VRKNTILSVFLVLALVLTLAGCGGGGASTESKPGENAKDQKVYKLKLGHVGPANSDHPWEKYALEFAGKINEATNGQVIVNTYPGSQLGADREMTEALQQGTMEIGLISTIAMGNFVPELQVWDMPYIFPGDNAKVDEILEGPVGKQLAQAAESKGLKILAYWENDWRNMSNSKRVIEKVGDLKGLKMRVVENQPSLDWFKRVGAIPTPMAFSEVYTALQQGTVDGQDNGTVLTYGSKFYEVQPYYTVTHHIYCPLAFVVSAKTWEALSPDLQEKITRLAVELGREQRNYNRQKAEQYLNDMEKSGVKVVRDLPAEALKGFQDSAQGTYDALGSSISKELINAMLEYRS